MATKKPKQPRLPGTEDAAIQELETAAEEYVVRLETNGRQCWRMKLN